MKYFVTLVYMKADGTFDRSTAMYDDFDSAKDGYHQACSTAIHKKDGENYTYQKSIVFMYDEDGTMKFKDVWKRE